MEKNLKRYTHTNTYTYTYMNHFAGHLELTHHCKSTVLTIIIKFCTHIFIEYLEIFETPGNPFTRAGYGNKSPDLEYKYSKSIGKKVAHKNGDEVLPFYDLDIDRCV